MFTSTFPNHPTRNHESWKKKFDRCSPIKQRINQILCCFPPPSILDECQEQSRTAAHHLWKWYLQRAELKQHQYLQFKNNQIHKKLNQRTEKTNPNRHVPSLSPIKVNLALYFTLFALHIVLHAFLTLYENLRVNVTFIPILAKRDKYPTAAEIVTWHQEATQSGNGNDLYVLKQVFITCVPVKRTRSSRFTQWLRNTRGTLEGKNQTTVFSWTNKCSAELFRDSLESFRDNHSRPYRIFFLFRTVHYFLGLFWSRGQCESLLPISVCHTQGGHQPTNFYYSSLKLFFNFPNPWNFRAIQIINGKTRDSWLLGWRKPSKSGDKTATTLQLGVQRGGHSQLPTAWHEGCYPSPVHIQPHALPSLTQNLAKPFLCWGLISTLWHGYTSQEK